MAPLDRLVFHIGVPKTGSSLLQKVLRNLRADLRERGVAYVDRNVFMAIPSYKAWAPYEHPEKDTGTFLRAFREEVERRRSQATPPAPTVLISNETASGRARDFGIPFWSGALQGISEIVDTLRPARTEIVVFVRRQDRMLESFYMQRIHRGEVMAWEEHRDTICGDDRVRYTELLEEVARVPGVAAIRIRPFEIIQAGAAAFVADFLRVIDSPDLVHRLAPHLLDPTNPSYSQPAWQAAMAINPLLDRPDQPKQVRKFLNELFPPGEYPKARLFTDEERATVIAQYAAENRRFFGEYLPDFPEDTYTTLDGVSRLATFLPPVEIDTDPA